MPKSNRRKYNGQYWTVQYVNSNGLFYNVGVFQSRKEALNDVIVNTENYPPGEGKIIYTR